MRGRNAFNVVSGARCVWDVVRSQAIGRTSFCAEWRVTVGTGAAAIITAWCLVGLGGFNCWRVAGMLCYALVRSACTFLGSVVESSGGAFWVVFWKGDEEGINRQVEEGDVAGYLVFANGSAPARAAAGNEKTGLQWASVEQILSRFLLVAD